MRTRIAIACSSMSLLLAACGAANQPAAAPPGTNVPAGVQSTTLPIVSTNCTPKPCAFAAGITVNVRAERYSIADWWKVMEPRWGETTCGAGNSPTFTPELCKNYDILLVLPTFTYSGTTSFTYYDSGSYTDLVDNVSHTVLNNTSCPTKDAPLAQAYKSKWPCHSDTFGVELRPGAKVTPGWLGWIMPSRDLSAPPTFEVSTQIPDYNMNDYFKIGVRIDPVPPRTSPLT